MRIKVCVLAASAMFLSAVGAQATGSLPRAEVGDSVRIYDVALRKEPTLGSTVRIAFKIENSSGRIVGLTHLEVGGAEASLRLGGRPQRWFAQGGGGLIIRHGEVLDFTTNHLSATIDPARVTPEDPAHTIVDFEIDGVHTSVEIH